MLDSRRQKDEASLLYIEGLFAALKRDSALKHIEHFVLGPVGVPGRLLALSRYILQKCSAVSIVYFAGFEGEVDAESIYPAFALFEDIRSNLPVCFVHDFLLISKGQDETARVSTLTHPRLKLAFSRSAVGSIGRLLLSIRNVATSVISRKA